LVSSPPQLRRTLLVRESVALNHTPDPALVEKFLLAVEQTRHRAGRAARWQRPIPQRARGAPTTNMPATKAA